MISACADRDIGEVFALVRRRAGLGHSAIGRRVQLTPSRVKEYIDGKTRASSTQVLGRVSDGLHIPGAMLGLAARRWEDAPSSVSLPVPLPALPNVSKDAEPNNYLAAMESFRSADRQLGGGHLYAAVVRYLSDEVAPCLFGIDTRPTRINVYAMAAALTEMAGWMAHDSGRDDRAAAHFERALPLAHAANDPIIEAHVLASMAHLASQQGVPGEAVRLARAGMEIGRRGDWCPALYGRLYIMEARGLASQGDARSRKSLDRAEQCVESIDVHPWISTFDRASYAGEAALCCYELHDLASARRHAEEAIELCRGGRVRGMAFGQLTLAKIHVSGGDLEHAAAVGFELLAGSQNLGSVRVLRQLGELRDVLDKYRDKRPIKDFLDQMTDAVRIRKMLLGSVLRMKGGLPE